MLLRQHCHPRRPLYDWSFLHEKGHRKVHMLHPLPAGWWTVAPAANIAGHSQAQMSYSHLEATLNHLFTRRISWSAPIAMSPWDALIANGHHEEDQSVPSRK